MTKEKIEEELKMLYEERRQLEDVYNMLEPEFTDAIDYKLKANNSLIEVWKRKLNDLKVYDRLLSDIKKIPPVSKQNGI